MINAVTVKDLDFSDLYLGHPILEDRFSDVPGTKIDPIPATSSLRHDLDKLMCLCKNTLESDPTAEEFKVCHDDITYRVSVMHSMGGKVFVLRKIASTISSLAEIGIPQAYIRQLMTKDLSGLFVVSGTLKSGKTMTACAIVKDRLTTYGGVAIAAENPSQLPVEGIYGQGVCFQALYQNGHGSNVEYFRHLLRWGAPTILMNEIRDQDTAVEALQASINGHLIIAPMMAENVIHTISKLQDLINEKMSATGAQSLLANGLVGVLHQQFVPGATKRKLETEFLFLKNATQTKTVLRNGNFELLTTVIRQQMASMITENATAQRYTDN